MQTRTFISLLLLTALLLLRCYLTTGTRWLVLAKMSQLGTVQNVEFCQRLKGLVKRQKQVCRRNLEVMESLRRGARLAIDECQNQFKNRRWNCSIVNKSNLFGNVLKQGTREAAFVHSISSAGVAHAVTRACSSGELRKCGCDRSVRGRSPEGFEWSGCSDNIAFGSAFSKAFVDARERAKRYSGTNRSLMNLHNNEAGRRAVHDNMKIQCKCHGVSGSCELKTCWKATPSFREIGEKLKEKFDGATEVEQRQYKSMRELKPVNQQFKPHTTGDLVYLDASPDFCEPDKDTGSLGTHNRMCDKSSKAIDGCDLMCCGRGFRTKRRVVVERCNCKFYWCCYVKCKQCRREVEEHRCI